MLNSACPDQIRPCVYRIGSLGSASGDGGTKASVASHAWHGIGFPKFGGWPAWPRYIQTCWPHAACDRMHHCVTGSAGRELLGTLVVKPMRL
jgi:hypothetical protein